MKYRVSPLKTRVLGDLKRSLGAPCHAQIVHFQGTNRRNEEFEVLLGPSQWNETRQVGCREMSIPPNERHLKEGDAKCSTTTDDVYIQVLTAHAVEVLFFRVPKGKECFHTPHFE